MDSMNVVDIALLLVVGVSVIVGMMRGLLKEMIAVLTWVAAYVVASYYAGPLASLFANSSFGHSALSATGSSLGSGASATISMVAVGVCFVILFMLTLVVGSIFNYLFSSLGDISGISFVNRILGSLFGLLRGGLVVVFLVFIVNLTPLATNNLWTGSKIVQAAQPGVAWLQNTIGSTVQSAKSKIAQEMQGVTISPTQVIDQIKSGYQNSGASQWIQN